MVGWILNVLITALLAQRVVNSIVEVEIILNSHLVPHLLFVVVTVLCGWQIDNLWQLITVLEHSGLRRFSLHMSLQLTFQ